MADARKDRSGWGSRADYMAYAGQLLMGCASANSLDTFTSASSRKTLVNVAADFTSVVFSP
jgi:hypothetical protein